MSKDSDRHAFEYADLKGKAYYSAYGKITTDFLHMYRGGKNYEVMLSAFLRRLFESPESISTENYKLLEGALVERVNALLAAERAQDKERALKGRKPVYELQGEDDEDEEDEEEPAVSAEEIARREAARVEEERQQAERAAAREEERRRNEEALRARARQVDAESVARLAQAVVLNPGAAPRRGGKAQPGANSVEEMEAQVAQMMRERERLQAVLQCSEEDLPARIADAARERDEAVGKQKEAPQPEKPMQQKQINARVAELKQKLTKLTTERNRLALQMKSELHPKREELLAILQQRDDNLAGISS